MIVRIARHASASLFAIACVLGSSAHAHAAGQTSGSPSPQAGGETPAPPVAGAAAAPADSGLGDIVVTARKTSENLQRAPVSITAVSGAELETRGISDAVSLAKILPNANLRTQAVVTQVFIRGIGTRTDLPNFANASAFLYNGVIVQRYGTFGLIYDLNRVESIAGPQGTLYGGSAAGGAVNLFTTLPKNDFSGYFQGEYGSFNNVHVTAAQDAPLGDKVSLRAAFDYNRRDSYYDGGGGIQSRNYFSAHGAALLKPTDNLTAHIFYTHGHDNSKPVTTLLPNPLRNPKDPYRIPATGGAGQPIDASNTYQHLNNDVIGANIDWNIGGGTLTYIPAYVHFVSDYGYYTGAAANLLLVYDRERQLSQELRYNVGVGPLKLTFGGFYLRNLTDFNDFQRRFTSPTASTLVLLNRTDQTNTTYAAFAQAIWSVTDRLRFTAGGRYTRDKIVASGVGSGGIPIAFDYAHSRPDYKVGIDYDVAPRILAYANLQSGYIQFGYNPDRAGTPIVPQSRLTAVSGGFKSRFLDNRLELNVEGFHYIYKNFQAIAFVNLTGLSTVLNAPKSTIYGADVSLRAKITSGLSGYVTMLAEHARYTDFSGVGYNYSGNAMINAPDFNFQGGLEQRFKLAGGSTITARVDTQYTSKRFGGFENFATQKQSSFHRTDIGLAYAPSSEAWSLEFYVRNLEDAVVYTNISGGSLTAPATGGLEAPRTFGGRFSLKWR